MAAVATTLTNARTEGFTLRRRRTPVGDAWRSLRRNPAALAGASIVLFWITLGLLAPVLPLEDQSKTFVDRRLQAPSAEYPLGTDDVGRDLVARVIWAARVSVPAGVLVIAVTGFIGCVLGAIAGYFGGLVDSIVMRACDAVLSFPSIILAMAIAAVRGEASLTNAMLAVILVLWPEYARLMRGLVLSIKGNEYVTAAESIGASQRRVLFRHIIPATDAPVVVKATLDVGAAIVLTAGLSFIGLGAVPPTAEWGAMINQGSRAGLQYWWYSTVPGIAIMSVVMGLNFFGDGLRDALDPRRRGR